MLIHVIEKNDTIYNLSKMYHIPMDRIIEDNAVTDPNHLVIGDAFVIRKRSTRHTVMEGQSLYQIAQLYHTNVPRILAMNPGIINPSKIQAGMNLRIEEEPNRHGMIEVNGYVYPNVNLDTMAKQMPFLTYLSIFSYHVRPDGTLSPLEDDPLIDLATAQKTTPVMVITNINDAGEFDSELAHEIFTNRQTQDKIIASILSTMKNKYTMLTVDFEYIRQSDKEAFEAFLRKLTDIMHQNGYAISAALAPKTGANQKGLLYEAHDYELLGQMLDHIILMTYEWGYTYGPAQAVAPYDKVEQVIQYAVSVIPSKKILMGIPNYGYDWKLPFRKGSAARTLSNTQAIDVAADVGADIQFDEKAKSPFFEYYDSGKNKHVVWFEDARSIQAKMELVRKYNLGGISFWTLMSYFPQAWVVINSMFFIKKKE